MPQPTKTVRKESSPTSTGSSKRLPLGTPAHTATDVFISTKSTQTKLETLIEQHHFVFVRAGVAAGKTTVVENWKAAASTNFVVIPSPSNDNPTQFLANIVRAINKSSTHAKISSDDLGASVTAAIRKARDEGTLLIFDEAHLLFASSDLVNCLIKDNHGEGLKPRVLMVSAANEIQASVQVKAPPKMTKFMWYPKPPQRSSLRSALQQAGIMLDEPSTEFFVQLSGNHRGILMCCFEWVRKKQNANEEWDIGKTITAVRRGLSVADHDVWCGQGDSLMGTITTCRAVKVNGCLSYLPSIPLEFVKLLCEGPKVLPEDVRRTLTIDGFVLPMLPSALSRDEFVRYDWTEPGAKSAVSNPLLAWYYRHHLEKHHHLTTLLDQPPMSSVDLLLTALPKMSFMYVVSRGGLIAETQQRGTSRSDLINELDYTSAINTALKSMHVDAQALEDGRNGKVDVYVQHRSSTANDITTFAMTGIMASRSQHGTDATTHDAHRRMFDGGEGTCYTDATHKCLFTIGAVKEDVYHRVACTKADGVTIVGIVAAAHHTRYHIFIKDASVKVDQDQEWISKADYNATHSGIVGPLTVECDHVAMRYDTVEKKLVSNQLFRSIDNKGVWAGAIWVCEEPPKGGEPKTSAFEVTPGKDTVDSLKKAIAPGMTPREQAAMSIFDWNALSGTPNSQALAPDSPLRANTASTPYTFQI